MNLTKKHKILIVGLGLIGGSYADGLTSHGFEVGAITKDKASIDFALKKGIIKSGTTFVEKEYVQMFDIVIFALYPKIFIEWIETYQSYFKDGTLITDVTGVKSKIVFKIQTLLKDSVEFVPAHPMAGKEVYGVENSDKKIFQGANFIITPTSKNTNQAIDIIIEMGKILGFKNISILSPEKHDEMIGFLSQLTHCIAIALMTCKESNHLVEYTGDSFRDLTRIAKINEQMWTELFLMNKNELLSQMDLFLQEFEKLRDALSREDVETIKKMMKLSTQRRLYFDR
ncbi:MAG: prephenate dehydrogenase [Bacilli bacterium]|nr:prephenate dehydrogenase [Staphylococcus sp.]